MAGVGVLEEHALYRMARKSRAVQERLRGNRPETLDGEPATACRGVLRTSHSRLRRSRTTRPYLDCGSFVKTEREVCLNRLHGQPVISSLAQRPNTDPRRKGRWRTGDLANVKTVRTVVTGVPVEVHEYVEFVHSCRKRNPVKVIVTGGSHLTDYPRRIDLHPLRA